VSEASFTFPAELSNVSAARRFLQATLRDWGNPDYDFGAPLVLTELVTNAALHARTPYTVRLRLEPTHLVVEVVDSSPRLPQARHYSADATTGRGINLVGSFSSTWGATPTPEGKVVWAHVRPDDAADLGYPADDELSEQPSILRRAPEQRANSVSNRDVSSVAAAA
jgi:hypothetical protein